LPTGKSYLAKVERTHTWGRVLLPTAGLRWKKRLARPGDPLRQKRGGVDPTRAGRRNEEEDRREQKPS